MSMNSWAEYGIGLVLFDETIDIELQKAVGGKDMFPEDFDWDGHIGEFSTTIYC